MRSMKAEVLGLLNRLPDDCPLEDIERALYVQQAIDQAEATGEDCIPPYTQRLGHHPEMLEGSAKDEVLAVLDLLPDDCDLGHVYYTLYIREKIRRGTWAFQNGQTYTHEQAMQRLASWLND